MADQIVYKRTVGIPEEIVDIRREIMAIRDDAAALVVEAKQVVANAAAAEVRRERAERQRQLAEQQRQLAERARNEAYAKMLRVIASYRDELDEIHKGLVVLGSLHDEHDYMYIDHCLHMSGAVAKIEGDEVTMKAAECRDDEIVIKQHIYGIGAN